MHRIKALDGLRGMAAMVVFLCHLIDGLLYANPAYHSYLWSPNAQFAIYVFFVISGTALSMHCFQEHDFSRLGYRMLVRYFRLSFLVLLSAVIVYALMQGDLMYNQELAAITDAGKWLGGYYRQPPTILDVLASSFYKIYSTRNDPYNPALWTIGVELYGSMLLYGVLYGLSRWRNWMVYVGALYLCSRLSYPMNHFMACFIYGIMLAHAVIKWPWMQARAASVLGSVVVVGAVAAVNMASWAGSGGARSVLAAGLVFGALASVPFRTMLETRTMQFLGSISIALYVVHPLVIASFVSLVYVEFSLRDYSTAIACNLTLLVALCTVISLAYLVVPLERATNGYAKRLARRICRTARGMG